MFKVVDPVGWSTPWVCSACCCYFIGKNCKTQRLLDSLETPKFLKLSDNGLRDVVLWLGPFGMKILDFFLRFFFLFAPFCGGSLRDDVK